MGRLFQLIEQGTLKADYIYNDAGLRTRKTSYQADGITIDTITIYHYDQMGYLVTETTDQGDLIKDYIWQEGMTPLAQIDNNASTETISYLYTDHLMTNRLATDEFQNIVWTWEGEAFGNTPAQELTQIKVNLRFPGQYYDQETNLHYNHFRYYDPELGRYITSDPIGLAGGINTFGYVGGNPLRYSDPQGLQPIPCPDGAPAGATCDDGKNNQNVEPKCVTAECAAGILPNSPATSEETCKFVFKLVATPACTVAAGAAGAPTAGVGGVVTSLACKTATKYVAEWVCEDSDGMSCK